MAQRGRKSKATIEAEAAAKAKPKSVLANCKPLGDRVVVKMPPRSTMTPGGIALPTATHERQKQGTVVSVGPGRLADDGSRIPCSVKKGDTVLFVGFAGAGFDSSVSAPSDGEYVILRDEDVVAILDSSDAAWEE